MCEWSLLPWGAAEWSAAGVWAQAVALMLVPLFAAVLWRGQKLKERQINEALKIVMAASRVQGALQKVRAGANFERRSQVGDAEVALFYGSEAQYWSNDQRERAKEVFGLENTFNNYGDIWAECRSAEFESLHLYGSEVSEHFKKIGGILCDLENAYRQYRLSSDKDLKRIEYFRCVMYAIKEGGEDDPITRQVKLALQGIEEALRPHLKLTRQ